MQAAVSPSARSRNPSRSSQVPQGFDGYDNVLEVYISYLQEKTEAGSEPRLIQMVWGVGCVPREQA